MTVWCKIILFRKLAGFVELEKKYTDRNSNMNINKNAIQKNLETIKATRDKAEGELKQKVVLLLKKSGIIIYRYQIWNLDQRSKGQQPASFGETFVSS